MTLIDAAYGIADSNKKNSQGCEKPSDTYKQDVITRIVEHVKTNGKLVEEIEKYNSAITDGNQKLDINALVVKELDDLLAWAPCYISKYMTDNDSAIDINTSMMTHVEGKLREKVREQKDEKLLKLFKPNEMKPGQCLGSVKYSISLDIDVKDRDMLIKLIDESGENFDELFENEAVQKFRTKIMKSLSGCFNELSGGRRRSKSAKHSKKRPTARRRRSSKRNARKARATRRR